MFTRSEFLRSCFPVFIVSLLCLFAVDGGADVILHSASWSAVSAGDSYAKETSWDWAGNVYVNLVDGPAWDQSAHADAAFDGVAHQVSGLSNSDLAQTRGSAGVQSWLHGSGFRAAGSISGDAFGDSGSTGYYEVDAWSKLDLCSSFDAVFELTASQWVDITGSIASGSEFYSYADTHIRISTLSGATLFDSHANPFASPDPIVPIAFSQLLAADSYRLELTTSYDCLTEREYFSCEGGYDITADFGNPLFVGVVPEPASISILCFGVMGLIANRLRRR